VNVSDLASKAFTSSSPIQNYKELYEENKKNVALFISQVDNELGRILKNH
jgi:ribosome biogenesis GTPase A